MIYLTKEETTYLLKLLLPQHPNWVKDSIADKIKSDIAEKAEREFCEHTFGEYTCIKQMCTKCGLIGEGMGESWRLSKILDNQEVEKMETKYKPVIISGLFTAEVESSKAV